MKIKYNAPVTLTFAFLCKSVELSTFSVARFRTRRLESFARKSRFYFIAWATSGSNLRLTYAFRYVLYNGVCYRRAKCLLYAAKFIGLVWNCFYDDFACFVYKHKQGRNPTKFFNNPRSLRCKRYFNCIRESNCFALCTFGRRCVRKFVRLFPSGSNSAPHKKNNENTKAIEAAIFRKFVGSICTR